jgi:hypothetical protein
MVTSALMPAGLPKFPALPPGGPGRTLPEGPDRRRSQVRSVLRATLLPLLLLATGRTSRCQLSTDSGTGELHISGTVHFLQIENGCWQLEAENGRRYELQPEQAPASLLHDGAMVNVVGQPAEGSETGCQVGMPIDVRRVVSVEIG